jgi:hypothetical protein
VNATESTHTADLSGRLLEQRHQMEDPNLERAFQHLVLDETHDPQQAGDADHTGEVRS